MTNFLSVLWDMNPVFFSLGGFEVRYYGLTWAFTFGVGMYFFINFFRREGYNEKLFDSIFWYAVLATIIGARLGHCLFYEGGYYLANPLQILKVWEGGLASHGAALGLLIGLCLFARRNKMPYLWGLDRVMMPGLIGGAAVRFGNLFNSEIYGTATDQPWGFIFVRAGETVAKHPTQIYEALCYVVGFAVVTWLYYRQDTARRRPGVLFGIGLVMLFLPRFFIEYIKNPQEDFEQGMSLMMGQWLSIPFVVAGVVMIVWGCVKPALKPKSIEQIAREMPKPKKKKKK